MTATKPTARLRGAIDAGVTGLGVALPETVVTNHDLEQNLDTSDEWITTRTGIRERRRAAPEQATSDLAYDAGVAALADAGIDPADVDAVVVATTTPDHLVPQTAPIVAARMGLEAPAFDVGAGCTGFVYGLYVCAGLVAGGLARRVLLIGAETLTRVIDPTDRSTAVLFGDGAGACVVTAGGGALGPFDLGSDGDLADVLCVPAGGTRRPPDADSLAERAHYMKMRGREVYRHAVSRMAASSRAVLDEAGVAPEEVDLFVGHQANARILDAVAQRVGIGADQAFVVVDRYGNTSAASIPIALADARADGRLEAGTRVLLTAFGAGLTWGSSLLTWTDGPADG